MRTGETSHRRDKILSLLFQFVFSEGGGFADRNTIWVQKQAHKDFYFFVSQRGSELTDFGISVLWEKFFVVFGTVKHCVPTMKRTTGDFAQNLTQMRIRRVVQFNKIIIGLDFDIRFSAKLKPFVD